MPILWWEKTDFTLFKRSAVAELVSFMRLRGKIYVYMCVCRERCICIFVDMFVDI
jgi:hypothetical protein